MLPEELHEITMKLQMKPSLKRRLLLKRHERHIIERMMDWYERRKKTGRKWLIQQNGRQRSAKNAQKIKSTQKNEDKPQFGQHIAQIPIDFSKIDVVKYDVYQSGMNVSAINFEWNNFWMVKIETSCVLTVKQLHVFMLSRIRSLCIIFADCPKSVRI